jgi:hypothetical protein
MRIFVASLIVFAVLYFWDKITTTANYWMGLTACDEPSPTIQDRVFRNLTCKRVQVAAPFVAEQQRRKFSK